MTSPEIPGSIDRLLRLPFREAVLSPSDALFKLRDRSVAVVDNNFTAIDKWVEKLPPPLLDSQTRDFYQQGSEKPLPHTPWGGLGITPQVYHAWYHSEKPLTFGDVILRIKSKVAEPSSVPDSQIQRMASVKEMSAILDVLETIDPTSGFTIHDGVGVVMKLLCQTGDPQTQQQNTNWFGRMLHDTMYMRTERPFERDYLADVTGAQLIALTAKQIASPELYTGIQEGIDQAKYETTMAQQHSAARFFN